MAAAPFAVFVTKYNRSTRSWECEIEYHAHLAFHGLCATNDRPGVYAAIGMLVAGDVGPKRPHERAAMLKAMLSFVESTQTVDDYTCSMPILPL